MNRKLAERLLLLVNDLELYHALLEYIQWRTEMIGKDIAAATDTRGLGQLQGRQIELNNLRTLREAVLAHSKA